MLVEVANSTTDLERVVRRYKSLVVYDFNVRHSANKTKELIEPVWGELTGPLHRKERELHGLPRILVNWESFCECGRTTVTRDAGRNWIVYGAVEPPAQSVMADVRTRAVVPVNYLDQRGVDPCCRELCIYEDSVTVDHRPFCGVIPPDQADGDHAVPDGLPGCGSVVDERSEHPARG